MCKYAIIVMILMVRSQSWDQVRAAVSVIRSGHSSPEDSGEAELHLNIEVSRQWSQSLASLFS